MNDEISPLDLSVLKARARFLQSRQAGNVPPVFQPKPPPAPATAPLSGFRQRLGNEAKGLAGRWWKRLRTTYGL